jgi:hypothetical protein
MSEMTGCRIQAGKKPAGYPPAGSKVYNDPFLKVFPFKSLTISTKKPGALKPGVIPSKGPIIFICDTPPHQDTPEIK